MGGKKSTHPNWPSGYESLKNENAVIILIRYKVFLIYIVRVCNSAEIRTSKNIRVLQRTVPSFIPKWQFSFNFFFFFLSSRWGTCRWSVSRAEQVNHITTPVPIYRCSAQQHHFFVLIVSTFLLLPNVGPFVRSTRLQQWWLWFTV